MEQRTPVEIAQDLYRHVKDILDAKDSIIEGLRAQVEAGKAVVEALIQIKTGAVFIHASDDASIMNLQVIEKLCGEAIALAKEKGLI